MKSDGLLGMIDMVGMIGMIGMIGMALRWNCMDGYGQLNCCVFDKTLLLFS